MSLEDTFGAWTIEESVVVTTPRSAVWALISDPTRIGEFSPECVHAEWIDGATKPVVGARFAGTNRLGDSEWTRTCTVIEAVPEQRFGYQVGDRFDGTAASQWSFELTEVGAGTRITQRFRHLPEGKTGVRLSADEHPDQVDDYIAQRAAHLSAGMRTTLDRMRQRLEGSR